MIKLNTLIDKKVLIIDTNDKKWFGTVEEYNPDDELDDYQGESIDVCIADTNELICFTPKDIQSIKIETSN